LYKVIQASRLYEQIVQQIEASILKGELSEGSQLPAERDLAKQFGVSRTAVREAIKALQEKGLSTRFRAADFCHERNLQFHAPLSGPDYQRAAIQTDGRTWWKFVKFWSRRSRR